MKLCLFCRKITSDSQSKEHIIPESLGSYRVVLRRGIVCDSCNNYFALKIEKPLLEHSSFRNVRAWFQVPTKKGKLPSVLGKIAGTDTKINLRLNDNGHLKLALEDSLARNSLKELPLDNNPFLFPISITPPKKLMSRFLAKMALEFFAFRFISTNIDISQLIENSLFDLIRNYARYNSGVDLWPFSQRTIYPMDALMRDIESGKWVTAGIGYDLLITSRKETYFVFLYHGQEFVINTGGPSIKGYEEWLEQHGGISPFLERQEVKVVEKNENGKIVYYLEGENDLINGIEFDRLHSDQ